MSDKESLNNQTMKKTVDPAAKPVLKSAKNMVGYAEDKEIDPKLLKVGEMVRADTEKECEDVYTCSDDELISNQEKREEILAKDRLFTGK